MANRNTRQTSKKVASKASKILRDGRYSKNSKSVAASALSQTKQNKKKQIFYFDRQAATDLNNQPAYPSQRQ